MKPNTNIDIKKQVTREIIQTVGVPLVSGFFFFFWIYLLITAKADMIFVYPLSGIIMIVLYFFSGTFYSGILLGFLSIIGFLCVILTSTDAHRIIFFFEIVWLWALFFLFEHYQRSYFDVQNRIREEEDILDTRITLLNSKIEENQALAGNIKQQISNYQLLGDMVQTLGSTLNEEQTIPLVSDLANKVIGKGVWSIKKSTSNDPVTKYIKDTRVPLIVTDMASDNRLYIKNQKFSSLIAVPLEVNDKIWGTLKGEDEKQNAFNESDLRTLSILGGIASLALTNAKLYERTQELAITDGLTGLYVQSYFKERLAEEILRSQSHKLALSVVIFDVDLFKKFNDTYGHAAGDSVLRQISNILRNCLRETDLISRYGGEEFAVLMLQTDMKEAHHIAEIIIKNVEAERFYLPVESFQPVQVRVTISAGAATLHQDTKTLEALLSNADEALYRAKKKGRNRVEIFQEA